MSNRNVLFIGQDFSKSNEGLTVVTKRNLRLLEKCGYTIDTILIPTPSTKTKIRNLILRESYGETKEIKKKIDAALNKDYLFVFFDRSIFGSTLRKFSKKGFMTISFFHNVEVRLSRDRFKVTHNPLYLLMYSVIAHNEKLTLKYADSIIAISERDQKELKGLYKNNDVQLMPTSFMPLDRDLTLSKEIKEEPYCLFVGTNFFANLEGVKWFVEEVAPNISMKVKIVGTVCNPLRVMSLPQNVKLEGRVDDLTRYYENAVCVICPIFSGSGLKTKTIEALRYGKIVFGTDEAFVGVSPACYDEIGKLCNKKEEFVEAINAYSNSPRLINEGSLNVFKKYFSDEVAFETLNNILSNI